MIEIRNITKSFGNVLALDDISLSFESGILAVCGAKNAGKTALLDILACVSPVSSGSVLLDGKELGSNTDAAKKTIGYMSELAPVFEDMTPYEFLTFIGEAKKIPDEKLYRQIDELLELTALETIKDKPIAALSRGKRKILSLAQTLLGNPSLIILDEPFAGMTQKEMADSKALIKMLGDIKTVVVATRAPSSLADVCQKIAILCEGRLTAFDTPEALSELAPLDELCAPPEPEIVEVTKEVETVNKEVSEEVTEEVDG